MARSSSSAKWKMAAGIALSLFFIYLAFRRADMAEMLRALGRANYGYLLPLLAVIALGLYLRSLRWRYLLAPVRELGTGVLFASLSIGYMANVFMPAHLGEFVRAWHVGKRTGIASGSVFATIVVERLIDVASLLLLLGLALLVFPFPGWVRQSGVVMMALVAALGLVLWLMKRQRQMALAIAGRLLSGLPAAVASRACQWLEHFLCGVVPLKRRGHYFAVAALSLLIWATYALTFQLLFQAFGFVARYRLPWTAALVAMVITTISVVVPSSPGYVGTFHFLCQLSLGLFGVAKGPALSYAFVLHAVSVYPLFFLGLFFLAREKLSLRSLRAEDIHALDR
ncbi:MAG: flippase-like domain-containing protein [Acidobacteria bacterium]|nr:flippase-like domain-containing protein [Acidobacteriota bacterium]